MRTRRFQVLASQAALAALAVGVLASCSKPYGHPSAASPVQTTTTIPGSETPAQTKATTLRASLDYLLVEHGFLLGRVLAEVVAGASPTGGPIPPGEETTTTTLAGTSDAGPFGTTPTTVGTPQTTVAPGTATVTLTGAHDDAAAALDANSHDLADAVAAPYGPDFAAAFYSLWTTRIDEFEDLAMAKATSDTATAGEVTTALANNVEELGRLFNSKNQYLAPHTPSVSPATGLADELGNDNTLVVTLIGDLVSKSSTQWADLVTSVEGTNKVQGGLPHTAAVLASAANKLQPGNYPGTATGTAANLRASMTTAFLEQVELIGLVTQTIAAGGDATAQQAELNANVTELHSVFASVWGDVAASQFDAIWREAIGDFIGYANAKQGGDSATASSTSSDLATVATKFGSLLSSVTKGTLSSDSISADMTMVLNGLTAAIDAAGSRAPNAVTLVRTPAAAVPGMASTIAEAIAEANRTVYLP